MRKFMVAAVVAAMVLLPAAVPAAWADSVPAPCVADVSVILVEPTTGAVIVGCGTSVLDATAAAVDAARSFAALVDLRAGLSVQGLSGTRAGAVVARAAVAGQVLPIRLAQAGAAVKQGDPLALVRTAVGSAVPAVVAPVAGVAAAVLVVPGDRIVVGDPVIVIAPAGARPAGGGGAAVDLVGNR